LKDHSDAESDLSWTPSSLLVLFTTQSRLAP